MNPDERMQALIKYLGYGYSTSELEALVFRYNSSLDGHFPKTKSEFIFEFVKHLNRHGDMATVWNMVAKERPSLGMRYWDGSVPEPEPEPPADIEKSKVTDEATLILEIQELITSAQTKLQLLQRMVING